MLRFLLVAACAHGTVSSAAELRIVEAESIFAVVTHKAGFASGRAHNHFITAGTYKARLEGIENSADGASFEIEVDAEHLRVDVEQESSRWYPRLEALGILAEPFGPLDDADRTKIWRSMLGPQAARRRPPRCGPSAV